MNPRPAKAPKVKVGPLQSKFLKFVWLLSARDWTNEIVIVGVLILGAIDLVLAREGQAQLAYTVGGGLIGYLVRDVQQLPEIK